MLSQAVACFLFIINVLFNNLLLRYLSLNFRSFVTLNIEHIPRVFIIDETTTIIGTELPYLNTTSSSSLLLFL